MKIINGKVYSRIGDAGSFHRKELYFSDKIESHDVGGEVINARGCYVIPGYIDVHTHGRGGIDVMNCDGEGLQQMAHFCAMHGTTTIFPTVMTNPYENIVNAVKNIAAHAAECEISIPGIHIEGPYISEKRPGCHVVENIRPFSIEEADELIRAAGGLKVHFTVAPEKDGGKEFIKFCIKNGASVSIGHSDASYEQCQSALTWGCTSFTHTFNAMSPFNHRSPGCALASLDSDAYSEFICDLFHVAPEVIKYSYREKDLGKFVIVTDSLPSADLPDGRYMFAGTPINVSGDKILTDDGTIAGSGTNMHDSVVGLRREGITSFARAIYCATVAPAKMMGLFDRCGSLDVGKDADIVLVNEGTRKIKCVISRGKIVYRV